MAARLVHSHREHVNYFLVPKWQSSEPGRGLNNLRATKTIESCECLFVCVKFALARQEKLIEFCLSVI